MYKCANIAVHFCCREGANRYLYESTNWKP